MNRIDYDQCSCTDCYNTEPDKLSMEHVKDFRIGKLHQGKHLTPRERKLLNELIKTRAIYDDVRSEIFSNYECDPSCVDVDSENLHRKQREDGGDNKNKRTIHAIVDLVDKGKIPPPVRSHPKLKEPFVDCQDCCNYGFKEHRYKNTHMHNKAKINKKVDTYSSSRLHAKRATPDRARKMRSVHFNTKYIRSDPCTCTMNIQNSANNDKTHPAGKHIDTKTPTEIESKALKAKRCVCECNLRKLSMSKKSLQMIKNARKKVRESIQSSISKLETKFKVKKDSIVMFRERQRDKRNMKKYECEPNYCIPEECSPTTCYEKIKSARGNEIKSFQKIQTKSSAASLKKTKGKKKLKSNYICLCEPEPEMEPKEHSYKYYDKIKSGLESVKKSIHDMTKTASDESLKIIDKIQSKRKQKTKSNHVCLCEPEPEPKIKPKLEELSQKYYDKMKSGLGSIRKSFHEIRKMASGVSFKVISKIQSQRKQKTKSKHIVCTCEPTPEPIVSVHGDYYVEPVVSKIRISKKSTKKNGLNIHIEPSVLTKKSIKKKHFIVCECDKFNKKQKHMSTRTETEPLFVKNTSSDMKVGEIPHPKVCEASICLPGECDYRKCAEILMSQSMSGDSGSHHRAIGSLSKNKSRHSQHTYDKRTKSQEIGQGNAARQVVRIGSNFSFNIEFYKENKLKENTELMAEKHNVSLEKENVKKNRHNVPRRIRSRNKYAQSEVKRSCDTSICHGLRRCFCTLALKDERKESKTAVLTKEKSSSANFKKKIDKTILCECDVISKIQKTQTLNDNMSVSVKSKSFARDSFFDSSESCNPTYCKKRLEFKRHSRGTSSPISSGKISVKSQCSVPCPNQHKKDVSDLSVTKKNAHNSQFQGGGNTSNRSVVRIGSTFSFDIQFYKESQLNDAHLKLKDHQGPDTHFDDHVLKRKNRDKHRKTQMPILMDSYFRSGHNKNNCSTSCGRSKSTVSASKTQTIPRYKSKATKMKSIKKVAKNICECDISVQTSTPIVYVTPPLVSPSRPLCTLDECDPFCMLKKKRVSKYSFKSKRLSTDNRLKSVSSNTAKTSDASSSKRQLLRHRHRTRSKKYDKIRLMQPESRHRQAVRIGSSFSFNVEFYKDKMSEKQGALNNNAEKKEKKKVSDVIQIYKNNDQITESLKILPRRGQKSIQVGKTPDLPKESIKKPFIDRCLCTLKLLKTRRDTNHSSNQPKQVTNLQKSRTCQCEIRKATYHPIYKSKQSITDTKGFRSMSSGTSKSYMKFQNMQAFIPESGDQQPIKSFTDSNTKECEDQESKSNKQVVRISSSFSFNVEFYKETEDSSKQMQPIPTPQLKRINNRENDFKVTGKSSRNIQRRKCHKKTITQKPSEEKAIDDLSVSVMKRCLCALRRNKTRREIKKSHKQNKSTIVKESKKAYNKRILAICECEKSVDTRSFKQLRKETSVFMKSAMCCTDDKPIKQKTHKNQSEFGKPNFKAKVNMQDDNLSSKQPPKQIVRIGSSFSFNIEFSKQKGKATKVKQRERNISKLPHMKRPGLSKNSTRDRLGLAVTKQGKTSQIPFMLKQCLCHLKSQNKVKINNRIANPEKDTQVNLAPPYECEPHLCEKSVMVNRKQRKVKSVLDVKNPCLKTKKVQSNLRETSTLKHSEQSIIREQPKQKHRLHKTPSKKAVHLGSAFKFDVEFYKQFGSLEDDGSINYKKLIKDQNENNLKEGRFEGMSIKKLNDKKVQRPYCLRHKEYQVGFMTNDVPVKSKTPFHQEFHICYLNNPNRLMSTPILINPVIVEGNPYRNINTKSNIKYKHTKRWRRSKKHVKFVISNSLNKVSSFKLYNKKIKKPARLECPCSLPSKRAKVPKNESEMQYGIKKIGMHNKGSHISKHERCKCCQCNLISNAVADLRCPIKGTLCYYFYTNNNVIKIRQYKICIS